MSTMFLITSICLVAVGFTAFSWWALARRRLSIGNWAGCAVVLVWLTGSGVKVYLDRSAEPVGVDRLLSVSASADWRMQGTAVPTSSTPNRAIDSVGDLIGGLEARLADQPDDAKGWALLAQSYSFVGDDPGTERAIARAVALGFEEQDLRNRVAHARRDTAPDPTSGNNGG